VSARAALQGRTWAVAYDFGSHLVVYDSYMTKTTAQSVADQLNRQGCSPGGTPYEAMRIAF
jgi:hypothetical protein